MKKTILSAALAASLVAGSLFAVGCTAQSAQNEGGTTTPAGAPPVMPANHDGRFESRGAAGCYGCHGAGEAANPMLKNAVALPENHYLNGDVGSKEMDPTHEQCLTCHVQG